MPINPVHVNTLGLVFDILGAWLVAIEVVNQFRGKKYENDPTWDGIGKPPWDTDEYKKWELSKYKLMWIGLICLTVGFSLQIASNYIKTNPSVSAAKPTTAPQAEIKATPNMSPAINMIEPIKNKTINEN